MGLEGLEELLTEDVPDEDELPDSCHSEVFTLVEDGRVGAGGSGDDVPEL